MEREVDNALSTIHQRVNGVKGSLQTFMRKLELGGVIWPDVNENFTTLAGQLNFLQKALTKEDTPQLQNLVLLPLMTSTGTGPDTTLEQLTEGRIPYMAQDSLPNYLRTKLDLEIEKKEHFVNNEVDRISENNLQQQICDLNNLSDAISEIIQTTRDSWDDLTPHSRLPENENKELNKLMSALETGKGLRSNNRKRG
ncbi:hypothetical protein ACHWQZ_G005765 [Mnemiopsis leidyi]